MREKSVAVMQVILGLFVSLSVNAQAKDSANTGLKFPDAGQFVNANISYKVISSANNTFCYDIYSEGKMMIHQPSKPGMAGNRGFKTEEEAIRMANFVINKIKNGEMPPTVTEADMRQLKLLQ
jgi:hypothetical protein